MNIHEYQGKELLKKWGVKIQEGYVADSPEEAKKVAQKLKDETGTGWFVIKAQIHAGGRGKGKVQETGSNGVVLAKSLDEVPEKAKGILNGTLVTIQTGPEGKK
ncbi:Succinyl-CoA ligase [ADP-forming] subunit beta [Cesiribacter andamanensis AMV16]|uniref:Succinyl-CoA ligase [ADP-forming] subunit beta n=1 Tax=Cesiribacter andamanensis AMV16 TaxID=1279009 RepID=M7MZK3_9BACT|nr:Succinyl-CoA ligase [ADP-forming] subunit beta [Cesiribacter andamanensis AMV16]